MRLDEKHVGFYMADAVGHGMPAALLTMFIKHALLTKQITSDGYRLLPPGEVMANLNESMIEQNLSYATFATAVYGYVNVETLQVKFARAGHPLPLLMGADGSCKDLAADGSLLGIFPKESFQTSTYQLQKGDRLMIFTDGVEVAFGAGNNVDINQWRREIEARRSLTSEQLLQELSDHIEQQTGSLRPKDDLTVVMIDVLP
jgi:sigma-B regulation protein RsbU (phosphoserine phosphatase)